MKIYTAEQRARRAEYCRRWRERNAEYLRQPEQRAKRREYFRRWLEKNREADRENRRQKHYNLRIAILDLIGGRRCSSCGFSDWRALHVDHVNGGGSRERKLTRGRIEVNTAAFLRSAKNNPDKARLKYQVLCANCNFIKRYEQKECFARSSKNGQDSSP